MFYQVTRAFSLYTVNWKTITMSLYIIFRLKNRRMFGRRGGMAESSSNEQGSQGSNDEQTKCRPRTHIRTQLDRKRYKTSRYLRRK